MRYEYNNQDEESIKMSLKCHICGKTIHSKFSYCNDCFENIKKRNQEVFRTIVDEWKLEAKKEETNIFLLCRRNQRYFSRKEKPCNWKKRRR